MADSPSTVIPGLRYRDAQAAIDWFCKVFGFEQNAVYKAPDGSIAHAQLTLGGGMIMLGSVKEDEHSHSFKSPEELGGVETSSVYIVVPDADAAFARAVAAGATVVRPPNDPPYGGREFAVKDPEGHSWTAGTYDPWVKHE
jgi:uncharacterized glyoxalase superfamily protein PhnB